MSFSKPSTRTFTPAMANRERAQMRAVFIMNPPVRSKGDATRLMIPEKAGRKYDERVYEDQAPEKGHECLLYESARASPTRKSEPVITMTSSSETPARTRSSAKEISRFNAAFFGQFAQCFRP